MSLTIKQLMQVHEAIVQAMSAMDRVSMQDHGQSWRDLNYARAIVRVAIESTGAVVELEEAA